MADLYEILSDEIASEVTTEVRDNVNHGDEIAEKEVDDMIWSKAMDVCKGDIDHFDVIDMAKAKLDCWDVIIPAGA